MKLMEYAHVDETMGPHLIAKQKQQLFQNQMAVLLYEVSAMKNADKKSTSTSHILRLEVVTAVTDHIITVQSIRPTSWAVVADVGAWAILVD
jgi:hypothetical protein